MKKILLIFVGILLSGFLVGCGEIEYRVHVVISGTEEPVENAQVTIDDIGTDITDGLGNAAIIVDSSYVGNAGRLTVRADDFEPYTLQIDLVEQDRPKEVPLRPIISEPLVIADFDSCAAANDLGGPMGAAYNPPDFLEEKYIDEPEHGCVASLCVAVTKGTVVDFQTLCTTQIQSIGARSCAASLGCGCAERSRLAQTSDRAHRKSDLHHPAGSDRHAGRAVRQCRKNALAADYRRECRCQPGGAGAVFTRQHCLAGRSKVKLAANARQ